MRKLAYLGAIAAGLMGTAASAATTITFDIQPGAPSGTYQSGFGVNNQVSCDAGVPGCAGAFTASGTFAAPVGFDLVGATVTSGPADNDTTAANDIDFFSGTLNSGAFTFIPNGVSEFGTTSNTIPLMATNTLTLNGYTGGRGTFSGTLTFRQRTPGVPEPSTWAMLLVGFGGVGFAMRRRKSESRSQRVRVAYS